jgi:hypothetical protein
MSQNASPRCEAAIPYISIRTGVLEHSRCRKKQRGAYGLCKIHQRQVDTGEKKVKRF